MCDIVTYCQPSKIDPFRYIVGARCQDCEVEIAEKTIDAGFVPMMTEKAQREILQPAITAHGKSVLEIQRLAALMP